MLHALPLLAALATSGHPLPAAAPTGTFPHPIADPLVPDYSHAPEPYREFLLKARAADDIADPLQRCLAYPLLPESTNWPTGLLQAQCEYEFGPQPERKEILARIDAGDVAWLQRTFKSALERHFSKRDFSEQIHKLYENFGSDYDSGRATQRWLKLAPDSPYAMAARAKFYEALGWDARGGKWMAETPDVQVEQMEAHHAKAQELYWQALARETRLLPAYVGLVELGKNDNAMGERAFEAAVKVDPACKELMYARMRALEPRWGGSYEQMLALEQQMLPYLDKRPLLALARVMPYVDQSDVLYSERKYAEAAAALRPMLAVSSSAQVFEKYFQAKEQARDSDGFITLAYAVEAKRFRLGTSKIAFDRGYNEFGLPHDYELARRDFAWSVAGDPEDALAHSYYAMTLSKLGQFDKAEREFFLALKYDTRKGVSRREAITSLANAAAQAGHSDLSLKYSAQAIEEFPKDGIAWYARAVALHKAGAPVADQRKALETARAYIDPTVFQARVIEHALQDIAQEQGAKP